MHFVVSTTQWHYLQVHEYSTHAIKPLRNKVSLNAHVSQHMQQSLKHYKMPTRSFKISTKLGCDNKLQRKINRLLKTAVQSNKQHN